MIIEVMLRLPGQRDGIYSLYVLCSYWLLYPVPMFLTVQCRGEPCVRPFPSSRQLCLSTQGANTRFTPTRNFQYISGACATPTNPSFPPLHPIRNNDGAGVIGRTLEFIILQCINTGYFNLIRRNSCIHP